MLPYWLVLIVFFCSFSIAAHSKSSFAHFFPFLRKLCVSIDVRMNFSNILITYYEIDKRPPTKAPLLSLYYQRQPREKSIQLKNSFVANICYLFSLVLTLVSFFLFDARCYSVFVINQTMEWKVFVGTHRLWFLSNLCVYRLPLYLCGIQFSTSCLRVTFNQSINSIYREK